MEATLVTVTLLSLAMAVALSAIVWRMLRDERRRGDARVAALTEMAALTDTARPEPPPRHAVVRKPAANLTPAAAASPRRVIAAPAPSPIDNEFTDFDLPLGAPRPDTMALAPLFAEPVRESPWVRRLAVIGLMGLIAGSIVFLALASHGRAPAARRAPAETPAAVAAGATANNGLELLSLRDTRQPGSLTITGLVQNPRDGASLSRVTVTAYTFDDHGAFLASGRAPIEIATLAPGDESPFVVTVPVSEGVARYRIGFRGEDGRVIAHIDKRQTGPVATNW
jgi:hypothetical protein